MGFRQTLASAIPPFQMRFHKEDSTEFVSCLVCFNAGLAVGVMEEEVVRVFTVSAFRGANP